MATTKVLDLVGLKTVLGTINQRINSAKAPLATANTVGTVKPGEGVKVDAEGTLSVDTAKVATPGYVDGKIADLIGGAPEALDTLKEIADALGNDKDLSATLTTEIGKKANSADVYTQTQADGIFAKASDYAAMSAEEIQGACDEVFGA